MSRPFTQHVKEEVVRARTKFPSPEVIPDGWTHGQLLHFWASVIREEYEELWDEAKAQKFNPEAVLMELRQISATCERASDSLKLTKAVNSKFGDATAEEKTVIGDVLIACGTLGLGRIPSDAPINVLVQMYRAGQAQSGMYRSGQAQLGRPANVKLEGGPE